MQVIPPGAKVHIFSPAPFQIPPYRLAKGGTPRKLGQMKLGMRKTLITLIAASVVLGGCGRVRNSWVNPFNWFGGGATEVAQVAPATPQGGSGDGSATALPADPRPLVDRVTAVDFDRFQGGVIVRATGLPPSQGWWKADLVARPVDADGVLVLDFRINAPLSDQPAGTPRSREVTAAASVSAYKMQSIRRIVVQGASNAMGANR